jgi:hypothetical protein
MSRLISQSDTLNQYNDKGKKQGYWLAYLNEKLKRTDSCNAIYYGYEYFENGQNLTNLSKRDIKKYTIEPSMPKRSGLPILLDGEFVLKPNSSVKYLESYKNGMPYIFKAYVDFKNIKKMNFEQEYLDFTKKYKNQIGSFYWEERSPNTNDTTKYWFRKFDGKWQSVKIE